MKAFILISTVAFSIFASAQDNPPYTECYYNGVKTEVHLAISKLQANITSETSEERLNDLRSQLQACEDRVPVWGSGQYIQSCSLDAKEQATIRDLKWETCDSLE